MKKVYLVSRGTQDDYMACAIFDTKELAQSFIDSFDNDSDFNEIEEWIINPMEAEMKANLKPFYIRMNKEGKVYFVSNCASDFVYDEIKRRIVFRFNDKDLMDIYLFATDEKNALEIANEKRIKLIESEKWGINFDEITI